MIVRTRIASYDVDNNNDKGTLLRLTLCIVTQKVNHNDTVTRRLTVNYQHQSTIMLAGVICNYHKNTTLHRCRQIQQQKIRLIKLAN